MSIANLLVPNEFNLQCNSLVGTTVTGSTIGGPTLKLPGYEIYRWGVITHNNTPTVVFTYPSIQGVAYTITNQAQGINPLGQILSNQEQDCLAATGGLVIFRGTLYNDLFTDAPLAGSTVGTIGSGTNIEVVVTGVAGQTIIWSGSTTVNF